MELVKSSQVQTETQACPLSCITLPIMSAVFPNCAHHCLFLFSKLCIQYIACVLFFASLQSLMMQAWLLCFRIFCIFRLMSVCGCGSSFHFLLLTYYLCFIQSACCLSSAMKSDHDFWIIFTKLSSGMSCFVSTKLLLAI